MLAAVATSTTTHSGSRQAAHCNFASKYINSGIYCVIQQGESTAFFCRRPLSPSVHSSIRAFTHSCIDSFIHSFIHAIICLFITMQSFLRPSKDQNAISFCITAHGGSTSRYVLQGNQQLSLGEANQPGLQTANAASRSSALSDDYVQRILAHRRAYLKQQRTFDRACIGSSEAFDPTQVRACNNACQTLIYIMAGCPLYII